MFDFSETPITLYLLLVNGLVSGYALFFDASLVDRLSFQPRRILGDKEYYRLITAGFVHAGVAHLAFNMITLFFFGRYLELLLGKVAFTVLYFGSELAAHGLALYLHRNNPNYAAVGASGAVSGVVFAYCLFFPFERIYFFFVPVGIPAILFAVGYVAFSIYAYRKAQSEGVVGGIAHEAHLGGAFGGVVLTILLEPRVVQVFMRHFGL